MTMRKLWLILALLIAIAHGSTSHDPEENVTIQTEHATIIRGNNIVIGDNNVVVTNNSFNPNGNQMLKWIFTLLATSFMSQILPSRTVLFCTFDGYNANTPRGLPLVISSTVALYHRLPFVESLLLSFAIFTMLPVYGAPILFNLINLITGYVMYRLSLYQGNGMWRHRLVYGLVLASRNLDLFNL